MGAIAAGLGIELPPDPLRGKGAVGQLIERALGATAGSRATPDFPGLMVELKTLPVDGEGRPRESTFVSSLDLGAVDRAWPSSSVRHKLRRVCWVVVEGDPRIPLDQRRCGASFLWSPSPEEEALLRGDYEDILSLVETGARIGGGVGQALQLRPKGRDSKDLRHAVNEEGAPVRMAPRAFYLRRSFTSALVLRHDGREMR
jgi:DNA mismatch repair protein MutH